MIFGTGTDRQIIENGVWYALNLRLHQDDSFYLDTRTLRSWLKRQLAGKTMLNAFAYTGSLGVAALAGGAQRVVQLDQNAHFLDLAAESCRLNNIEVHTSELMVEDFWVQVSRFKRQGDLFDCVVLDPPFFASSPRTRLDLNTDTPRLINKVRPLVKHGGWLVAVNNAVFLSGKAYLAQLEGLCRDGYLAVEAIIPVPDDCCGFVTTCSSSSRADPAPFNHSTKIAVLKARRKGG
jgi:23S rRNA (cytosine1962-C5)-methyltransferase